MLTRNPRIPVAYAGEETRAATIKRLLLCSLLAVALLLPACGEKKTPPAQDGPIIITFACDDYQRSQYKRLAQEFGQANPGIQVKLISADQASGTQGQDPSALVLAFKRLSAAADAFTWSVPLLPGDWSFLLDLGPFVDDPSFPADDFLPAALDHFRWQRGVYGLPAEMQPILIYYDRGAFDEAGAPYPRAGWTWDDFVQAALQLTQRQGDTVQRYGFVDLHSDATLQALTQQYDVALWHEQSDPPEPSFDTPQLADVLGRYTDLALNHGAMPLPGDDSLAEYRLVQGGKAAMWTDWSTRRSLYDQRVNLGLAPFPQALEAANPRTVTGGFFISAGTAHPEAAWRWLDYLSANYQPQREYMLPGRRSVLEQLSWWKELDEETRAVFQAALAQPSVSNFVLHAPLRTALNAVLKDGSSVDAALALAQEEALKTRASLANTTTSDATARGPSAAHARGRQDRHHLCPGYECQP
jgi:ABC-type glycerol-3-phosphate transport system substrate-binding protein